MIPFILSGEVAVLSHMKCNGYLIFMFSHVIRKCKLLLVIKSGLSFSNLPSWPPSLFFLFSFFSTGVHKCLSYDILP